MRLKERELHKILKAEGIEDAEVVKNRSGHQTIVLNDGTKIYCPGTPSDKRSLLNLRALIRRTIR